MEKPPPLPPRACVSRSMFDSARDAPVDIQSRSRPDSSLQTNGDSGTLACRNSTGSFTMSTHCNGHAVTLSPPPSLPPRRSVARAGRLERSACWETLGDEASPPLPPRRYNMAAVRSDGASPQSLADTAGDLIRWDSAGALPGASDRAATAAAAATNFYQTPTAVAAAGADGCQSTPDGETGAPPLPPRMPSHLLNAAPPPSLTLLPGGGGADRVVADDRQGAPPLPPPPLLLRRPENGDLIQLGGGTASCSDQAADISRSVLDVFDPLVADVVQSPADVDDKRTDRAATEPRSNSTAAAGHNAVDAASVVGTGTEINNNNSIQDADADMSSTYYASSDPFNYMYGASRLSASTDGLYSSLERPSAADSSPANTRLSPPPLPPRQSAIGGGVAVGPMTPVKSGSSCAPPVHRIREYKNRQLPVDRGIIATGGGNIRVCRTSRLSCDSDIRAFRDTVVALRSSYTASDVATNPGLVASVTSDHVTVAGGGVMSPSSILPAASVTVMVHSRHRSKPVSFTCDVNVSVEHVVMQAVCLLESSLCPSPAAAASRADCSTPPASAVASAAAGDGHTLRVYGAAEYLPQQTTLAEYEYVRRCVKFDTPIQLTLVAVEDISRPLARTNEDDQMDANLKAEDLIPPSLFDPVTYSQLAILLECVERECDLLRRSATDLSLTSLRPDRFMQAIKAVAALLGNIQTVELAEALDTLATCCARVTETQMESRSELCIKLSQQLSRVLDAVRLLLAMYTAACRTDFSVIDDLAPEHVDRPLSDVIDSLLVRVAALHRISKPSDCAPASCPPPHERYMVTAQLYHGSRAISAAVATRSLHPCKHMFDWVVFDEWLEFADVAICCLPRESRLVVTVYGLRVVEAASDSREPARLAHIELGWAAVQMFDHGGVMSEGGFLLPLWDADAIKELGPAPSPGTHPNAKTCLCLTVDLPTLGARVQFPGTSTTRGTRTSPLVSRKDFVLLDENTQQQLMDTIETDLFSPVPAECRELLWDRRHYLMHEPAALPRVLLAAHSWEHGYLPELHAMTRHWAPLSPLDALQLLLPSFPDAVVRAQAVCWLQSVSSDELVDYLPQLVQAVKHDTWDDSALARFLLERALLSPRVAHHLYWLLQQCLPSDGGGGGGGSGGEARYLRRLTALQRALRSVCGQNQVRRFLAQEVLLRGLYTAATQLKATSGSTAGESLRQRQLHASLECVHAALQHQPTALPLDVGRPVCGLDVPACSYFASNTLPLRLSFRSSDDHSALLPVIYKVGDDLRQDMLTVQMLRIMDRLWLRAGIDMRMVTFDCVATGYCSGMIEMVQGAETLRAIQSEHGLAGAFKDMPIAEWLAKHNPTTAEYQRAVDNFTASCAGYCVATYVLGICDRHNDNIMLRRSGHLFHIDFGKFLGDAQRFGAFKRDRAPFVLTSDMAYVINGGDKPSPRFQHFVDLCCSGFNVVRRHANLFLNLFALMTSSGIPGVTRDAVDYIQRALLPWVTGDQQAAVMFARLINHSLRSWFTPVNFFLHSLAQLRFSGAGTASASAAAAAVDANGADAAGMAGTLSFMPRRYSENDDGRLVNLCVCGYQKRYQPEKCYMYVVRVHRRVSAAPDSGGEMRGVVSHVFRSYKHFVELSHKLTALFPLVDFHSLPRGSRFGRSHSKQVAELRRASVHAFLRSLWRMADEVRHCHLVYTFVHPLLSDHRAASLHAAQLAISEADSESLTDTSPLHAQKHSLHSAGSSNNTANNNDNTNLIIGSGVLDRCQYIGGRLQLSLHYARNTLSVFVHHSTGLTMADGQEPSAYVKLYLLPDPHKLTKRKTKVVRRNSHPSFMEVIVYRMPRCVIECRTLQASVWHQDHLQENVFLGAVSVALADCQLDVNTKQWHQLTNFHR